MKHLIYIVIALAAMSLSLQETQAQRIAKMRTTLSERALDGSYVDITEDASTASATASVDAQHKASEVNGYRVVIYFDNGQYANDKAAQVISTFRNRYPHINAYLVYESPYFKVSVGDCLSMEEAVVLMNTFVHDYPKAFPKREKIKLSNLSVVHAASRDTVAVNSPTISLE